MDRLARNFDDLRRLVARPGLAAQGVRIEFVKEGLTFTGEDSPMATLLLSVMGAFAEFERALIRGRQREGIAAAKKRGAYTGRKPALSDDQAQALRTRAAAGASKVELAAEYGISRETVYAYLRARPAEVPEVSPPGVDGPHLGGPPSCAAAGRRHSLSISRSTGRWSLSPTRSRT